MEHLVRHFPEANQVDIVGDVHGCVVEFDILLHRLGFLLESGEINSEYNRTLVFVGDFVDRGPSSLNILRRFNEIKEHCSNQNVVGHLGNHDWKLLRALQGRNVVKNNGLEETWNELTTHSNANELVEFEHLLESLPLFSTFDDGKLVVSHAGTPRRYLNRNDFKRRHLSKCLYGEVDKENPRNENGFPNRTYEWCDEYNEDIYCVFGHTPVKEVTQRANTFNIDTGCVFGGKLTALRYPEFEIVNVDAQSQYSVHEGFDGSHFG